MQGRGEKPINDGKAPLTWWLAADNVSNKQDMLPFGWLLVEIDPKIPDSSLQQWLENGDSDLTAWMQRQLTKQNTLKQKAELRQFQEQEKRQTEQLIAEENRLKQEAEQHRLANLSPIDQEIEIFLKPIQQQEHDTRLLQELEKGRWQNADAKIVAQKIKSPPA